MAEGISVVDWSFHPIDESKISRVINDALQEQKITNKDAEILQKFLDEYRAKRALDGYSRIITFCYQLIWFRNILKKPFTKLSKEDVFRAINTLNTSTTRFGRKFSQNTRQLYTLNFKIFLQWMAENNYSSIPLSEINSIKLPGRNKNVFTAKDILTEEEIKEILDNCLSIRDRAFVSMLYDGGFRGIELCLMAWKDLTIDDEAIHARTNEKTGFERRVYLTFSRESLLKWKEEYSHQWGKPEGDNAVFVTGEGRPFRYSAARMILERLKERMRKKKGVEFKKKMSLHQFRRASITHEADKGRPLTHICMEKWGRSYSPMIETYTKPGEEEIRNSKFVAAGIEQPKRKYEKRKNILVPIQCPSCFYINEPTSHFCNKCATALTEEAKQEVKEVGQQVRKRFKVNTKAQAMFIELMKELDYIPD